MDEAMIGAVYNFFSPISEIFTEDADLWVKLDDVLDFCRFRIRGAELYIGPVAPPDSGVSTEGAAWAMEGGT
jgi:hypothetical protein